MKQANAVGMFKAWEDSKKYPEIHNLVRYLAYWVAGTKLIFILLFLGLLVYADSTTLMYSVALLVLSISSFYWKLWPLIREMDRDNQIDPKGYSKTLALMIFGIMSVLTIGVIYAALS